MAFRLYPRFRHSLKKGEIMRRIKNVYTYDMWIYPHKHIGDLEYQDDISNKKFKIPVFKGVLCKEEDQDYIDRLINTEEIENNLVTFHGHSKSISKKDNFPLKKKIVKTEVGKITPISVSQYDEEYLRIDTEGLKVNCYDYGSDAPCWHYWSYGATILKRLNINNNSFESTDEKTTIEHHGFFGSFSSSRSKFINAFESGEPIPVSESNHELDV